AGVTPDHMFRVWMTAYLMGCNTLLHEASQLFFYTQPVDGKRFLSDYGHKAAQFYAITRGVLEDRGEPLAPFAIMLEEAHGYRGDLRRVIDSDGRLSCTDVSQDEKASRRLLIWSGAVEATDDDWGLHRLVEAIWPEAEGQFRKTAAAYWRDGRMNSPVADGELLAEMRVSARDPRDYSRFLGTNGWSECFDFVAETIPEEALGKYYKTIILAGGTRTVSGNWSKLKAFMQGGGQVVASVANLVPETMREVGFDAQGQGVQSFAVGRGCLHVLPTPHGLRADGAGLSDEYLALLRRLHDQQVGVSYDGPPCQMLVNQRRNDTLVTLVNPTQTDWHGTIKVARCNKAPIAKLVDVLSGAEFPGKFVTVDKESVALRLRVPAGEVAVIAFGDGKARAADGQDPSNSSLSGASQTAGKLAEVLKAGPS
ncbi:MAG: hypothetical protein PHR35_17850, partial [Kiritimatiellae bacterium]|nr:hypothetical protein [Kiritimatiellia bacterium]